MRDWISDLLLFSAGVAGGVLITAIKPYLRSAKKKRTEMVAARARILADIKERHEEEILHEAFRTTEAIRGELNRSAQLLRKTLLTVKEPADHSNNGEHQPLVPLSRVID